MKQLLLSMIAVLMFGGCTFSEFAARLNGVGFFLILLAVALVVLHRLKNPEGRFKIGRKKRL